MENPLELPVPDDPLLRIETLARDLAYGVIIGNWGAKIYVAFMAGGEEWSADAEFIGGQVDPFYGYLKDKWDNKHPKSDVMLSLGYFALLERLQQYQVNYLLTQKAFDLLQKPITAPSIFISYKRDESSALALLAESRLKLVDNTIGVFIDKELEPGDKWHGKLEQEVRQRPYFICLLGPKSLGSKYVRNEIRWALEEAEKRDTVIIPICHNEYTIGAELLSELKSNADEISDLVDNLGIHNAIIVNPEGAEQYELAMIKLLNRLGYSNI